MKMSLARPTPLGIVVLAVMAIGFGLRVAAARGGLWLDEAWSAIYAAQAQTPLGVFLRINHDNNHHLNSLWLQAIGLGAPPLLARAPSIVAGTAAIAVAAAIGRRRSAATAVIAAVSFAVSPILVNYGAEARGYAMMTLALLAMILVVDRWLDDPHAPPPRLMVGALAAFGLLSQLTMVFGLVAIAGWVLSRLIAAGWRRKAVDRTVDLMTPAIVATLLMFSLVFGAAAMSATGLQVGSEARFTTAGWLHALHSLVATSIGVALPADWATVTATLLVTLSALLVAALRRRIALYLLMIVGLPAMIALLHVPNSVYERYFLVAGIGLLLLAADWAGALIQRGGEARIVAIPACAILVCASMARDARLITNDRADPAAPVRAMQAAAPGGTAILLDTIRPTAVLRVAAASAHYPLVIRRACPAAPFFLLDDPFHDPFPATIERCGATYRAVLTRRWYALSGFDWRLYRRQTGSN
jgi:uncharacterized membrane protein